MKNPIALIEAHQRRVDKMNREIEIAPNSQSIDLLRAVYRSSALPLHTRMRAAMACLKHEVPALIATAVVNESSFAELLDRRIARYQEMKLIEAKHVNGEQSIPATTIEPDPTPAAPLPSPLNRLYNTRLYRKF